MSNDTKKYRLLKDYPGIKAGEIIEPNPYGIPVTAEQVKYSNWPIFYSVEGNIMNAWVPKTALSNKDWFEEVLPEQPNKQEGRIEVEIFGMGKKGCDTTIRLKNYNHEIALDKFPAIKQAIEAVLNGDTVVEDKQCMATQVKYFTEAQYLEIWNMIFSQTGYPENHPMLKKPTPTPTDNNTKEREVLFTTEDGVEIREGDAYYRVNTKQPYNTYTPIYTTDKVPPLEHQKNFHKRAAAEQYILENKPCLSLSEIKQLTGNRILWVDEQSLIKAVKLKNNSSQ